MMILTELVIGFTLGPEIYQILISNIERFEY